MQVEIIDGDFVVDAAVLGDLLNVPASEIPTLMRSRAITSLCESGIDADQGMFRLSFYYRTRRARLRVDTSGHILQRSVIDFGEHPVAQESAGSQNPLRLARKHLA